MIDLDQNLPNLEAELKPLSNGKKPATPAATKRSHHKKPTQTTPHDPGTSGSSRSETSDIPPKTKITGGTTPKKLKDNLESFYGLIGLAIMPFDLADATLILQRTEVLAESAANLVELYPWLKKLFSTGSKGIIWGQFIVTHGGLIVALLRNHGMLQFERWRPDATQGDYQDNAPGTATTPETPPATVADDGTLSVEQIAAQLAAQEALYAELQNGERRIPAF